LSGWLRLRIGSHDAGIDLDVRIHISEEAVEVSPLKASSAARSFSTFPCDIGRRVLVRPVA
jgi:hypothetical protein